MPAADPTYEPKPIDTAHVEIGSEFHGLVERLSQHVHDLWATKRMSQGWRYAPQRDESRKLTPLLVPYKDLPESEKEVDRKMVLGTLKAVLALGYRLERS